MSFSMLFCIVFAMGAVFFDCKWEKVCENYRKSSSFIKLRKKLQKQKRISKRKIIEIKARN